MAERLTAYAKGVMGENTAAQYLMEKGLELLDRRWRCTAGEIDLILLEGQTLVFAEVKTRETMGRSEAQYAVSSNKQRRMLESARWYLGTHPEYANCMIRFDVVTVAKDGLLHIPNAFEGTAW